MFRAPRFATAPTTLLKVLPTSPTIIGLGMHRHHHHHHQPELRLEDVDWSARCYAAGGALTQKHSGQKNNGRDFALSKEERESNPARDNAPDCSYMRFFFSLVVQLVLPVLVGLGLDRRIMERFISRSI